MGDGGLRHSGQARCCCCCCSCAHGLPSCSALSPCSVQPLPSPFLQRPLLLFRVLHAPRLASPIIPPHPFLYCLSLHLFRISQSLVLLPLSAFLDLMRSSQSSF
ncbi:hypothetical protein MUK42_09070 [Musa troglodytarum]|uniref:Uncharacterized protein n=1 Tax=Musa troglodytarum TaxID=320322 RepID=A0A9E7L9Z9_9LILI|nr:hypothetical protein MUK42_09070 [Musa troglodytarum]